MHEYWPNFKGIHQLFYSQSDKVRSDVERLMEVLRGFGKVPTTFGQHLQGFLSLLRAIPLRSYVNGVSTPVDVENDETVGSDGFSQIEHITPPAARKRRRHAQPHGLDETHRIGMQFASYQLVSPLLPGESAIFAERGARSNADLAVQLPHVV